MDTGAHPNHQQNDAEQQADEHPQPTVEPVTSQPTTYQHLLAQIQPGYDTGSLDQSRASMQDAMSSHSSFMSEVHELDDVEYNQRRLQRRARQRARKTYYKIHGGAARDRAKRSNQSLKDKIFKFVPILRWSRVYTMEQFKSDLVAGVTVGAMVIPQGLAYATLAGLLPLIGIYTAFFTLITYSFMGSCGQLSVAPDAMTSILVRSFIVQLEESGKEPPEMDGSEVIPQWHETDSLIIASGLSMFCGILMILLGVFRFGFLDNMLSRAVLRGFVNAAALIILVEQLPPLGVIKLPAESNEWGAPEKLHYIFEHLSEANSLNLIYGIAGVGFLYLMKFLKKKVRYLFYVPDIFVLVVISIILSACNLLPGVPTLGRFPGAGFHLPHIPAVFYLKFSQIQTLIPASMVISIIGFVESTVCIKEFTAKHHYTVSSNKELVALGSSNVVASFFQSFPAFASLPRSFVNDATGAKTPMSSFVAAVVVAIVIQFCIPVFGYLPKVTMASIIIVAAIALIEMKDMVFMWKVRAIKEWILLLFIFIYTFIMGLEFGVLICLFVSVILVVKHSTRPRVTRLGVTPHGKFRDIDQFPEAVSPPGTVILRIEDGLYFANIGQVKNLISEWMEEAGEELLLFNSAQEGVGVVSHLNPLRLVIDFTNVGSIDLSALQVVEEMFEEMIHRGVELYFIKLDTETKERLYRSGVLEHIPADHFLNHKKEMMRIFHAAYA
eukprot:TRINITY_DN4921_c0_g1_i1.p1 TRINITY_DN4921_c0_g1~~TRINITY_DN4921_c0_g1_i1.p1  ORF type:complete len:723 (+),score=163.43 TRINITY_DN4921_c0_g1_i1:83-2251(+)